MYEQYFSKFSYADEVSPFCVIRLNDPFAGVEVIIAKIFEVTSDQQIKFDYEVTKVPDEVDKSIVETAEFIDLVKNIFLAILEEQLNKYAEPKTETTENNETPTPEGSVPAGPGAEEEGK